MVPDFPKDVGEQQKGAAGLHACWLAGCQVGQEKICQSILESNPGEGCWPLDHSPQFVIVHRVNQQGALSQGRGQFGITGTMPEEVRTQAEYHRRGNFTAPLNPTACGGAQRLNE